MQDEALRAGWVRLLTLAAVTAGVLLAPATAGATTFCIPTFSPGCPDNGTNVVPGGANNFQIALTQADSDGNADTIILAPPIVNQVGSGAGGQFDIDTRTDPLEIRGAGADTTTLTNSTSGSNFVMNLNDLAGDYELDLRDFTFEIPDTLDANGGSGIQLEPGALLEDVDIRNTHDGTNNAVLFNTTAGTFRGGHIYSEGAAAELDVGIALNNAADPPAGVEKIVTVDQATIEGSRIALHADTSTSGNPPGNVVISRSVLRARFPLAIKGLAVTATNAIFEMLPRGINGGDSAAISIQPDTSGVKSDGTFTGSHVTIVSPAIAEANTGYDGISALTQDNQPESTSATLTNSIIDVLDRHLVRDGNPNGDPQIEGDADFTIGFSDYDPASVLDFGQGAITDTGGNINADPLFVAPPGDLRLQSTSPAIDAGTSVGAPALDFDGRLRPLDGDGDGTAAPDMGAFEYGPPIECSNGLDDDGDDKVDFPADPGCENAADNDETDPEPADDEIALTIQGKKATLTRKGKLKTALRCPATEQSGPCEGKLKLKTRKKVAFKGKKRKVTLGSKSFSIAAGKKKAVSIKLSKAEQKLLRKSKKARKLKATAKVTDQAGNAAKISKKLGTKIQK